MPCPIHCVQVDRIASGQHPQRGKGIVGVREVDGPPLAVQRRLAVRNPCLDLVDAVAGLCDGHRARRGRSTVYLRNIDIIKIIVLRECDGLIIRCRKIKMAIAPGLRCLGNGIVLTDDAILSTIDVINGEWAKNVLCFCGRSQCNRSESRKCCGVGSVGRLDVRTGCLRKGIPIVRAQR